MNDTNNKLLNRVHAIVAFVLSEMYERKIQDCTFGEFAFVKGSFKQPEDTDPEDNLLEVGTVRVGASDETMGIVCTIITDLLWHECTKIQLFTRFDFGLNTIKFYGCYLEKADPNKCLNYVGDEQQNPIIIIDDHFEEVAAPQVNNVEAPSDTDILVPKYELYFLHCQAVTASGVKSRFEKDITNGSYTAVFGYKSDMVKYMRAIQRISQLDNLLVEATYQWEQGIISFFVTKKK